MKDIIGILDSGVGGISVLRRAVQLLPNENFLFYGDNANAPYGPRSLEEIRTLSRQATDYLLSRDVKALVIACNTITSAYAETLRAEVSIPVIGMEPAVKPASLARSGGKILALATRATLSLERFSRLMEHYGEGVVPLEGKGLVELVEAGRANSPEARAALGTIFEPYLNQQIDGIVLGCTHYPFLRRQIEAFFPKAQIFDGLDGTARQLKRRLEDAGLCTSQSAQGQVHFETSGDADKLELMRELFTAEL